MCARARACAATTRDQDWIAPACLNTLLARPGWQITAAAPTGITGLFPSNRAVLGTTPVLGCLPSFAVGTQLLLGSCAVGWEPALGESTEKTQINQASDRLGHDLLRYTFANKYHRVQFLRRRVFGSPAVL